MWRLKLVKKSFKDFFDKLGQALCYNNTEPV